MPDSAIEEALNKYSGRKISNYCNQCDKLGVWTIRKDIRTWEEGETQHSVGIGDQDTNSPREKIRNNSKNHNLPACNQAATTPQHNHHFDN